MAAGLRVIMGGLERPDAAPDRPTPTPGDVQREAARRLQAISYERHRVRSLGTGIRMPADIRHFKLQVDYVAQTLSRLRRIPADFADDRYWPQLA
ncbi:hypothetical protein [Rhizobium sp. CSW-27]|uniref:hypothetical protein n=1 Tax=Rhizobium sp. CSW-27 TaxID=2839985 RepID=UPI002078836D|nr:hypothetical protein [Rhizobium sp. CSW-27]